MDIKEEILDLTIENTQKYIKEKAFELSRNMNQIYESNKDNIKDVNNKDNKKRSQIDFEDLPYEKKIKDQKEIEAKQKEEREKKNKEMQKFTKYMSKRIITNAKKQKIQRYED